MLRRDCRSEPVRRMVVMGESNAFGNCAGDPANEWVQALAWLLRRFQDGGLRVYNNAIPSNVISPDAPAYPEKRGTKPSALERYREHMIDFRPDLAIYAYGLNDSRCGHPLDSFMRAYETIVADTRAALPDALIVLAGPYWNIQYDEDEWAKPDYDAKRGSLFDETGEGLVVPCNDAIRDLAARHDALFVDLYNLTKGAKWLLNDDTVHFHDMGQWLLGQTVFAEIARNCSFIGKKSIDFAREAKLNTFNTGGANALPRYYGMWRPDDRQGS